MVVVDALPSGGTAVHQQVVAIGMEFGVQDAAQLKADIMQGLQFGRIEFEEVPGVPFGYDEAMALGEGMDVPDSEEKFVFNYVLIGSDAAKDAIHYIS